MDQKKHHGLQCFAVLDQCLLWVAFMCEQVTKRSWLWIENWAAGEQELLGPQMVQRTMNDQSGSHIQIIDAMLICSDLVALEHCLHFGEGWWQERRRRRWWWG